MGEFVPFWARGKHNTKKNMGKSIMFFIKTALLLCSGSLMVRGQGTPPPIRVQRQEDLPVPAAGSFLHQGVLTTGEGCARGKNWCFDGNFPTANWNRFQWID